MVLWYFSMLFDTYHFQFWQFDMTVKQHNISVPGNNKLIENDECSDIV
ncbi:TPA: hypothetical protein R9Z04_005332 [Bacillus cereus]|nr:hypothetical protein [Bacillus cereus]